MFVLKKYFILSLLLIFVAVPFAGCGINNSSEFDDEYNKFSTSFLSTSEFLVKGNDLEQALREMDYNQVNIDMSNMKKSMAKMSNLLDSERNKRIYSNITDCYKQLEFLIYASKNFDNLTTDEKRNVNIYSGAVISYRDMIIEDRKIMGG